MKILSDLKLEDCEKLNGADKISSDEPNTKNLTKASSPEEAEKTIKTTGFYIELANKNNAHSELLKMKLSNFRNKDKPIKVFSWLLGETVYFSPSVWITHKLELKKHGLPIYTAEELAKIIRDANSEALKVIHRSKKVFGGNLLSIEGVGDAFEGK